MSGVRFQCLTSPFLLMKHEAAWPKQLIHQRRAKSLERRTSNVQHRTLNIDDATLCRFYTQRTAESFGGQITSVNSLPDFVVTSAKQFYAVFFLNRQNTLFDVGRSMFDVRRSSVSFLIRLAVFLASGGALMTNGGESLCMDRWKELSGFILN
jgi:hypothetical protein